MIFIPMPTTGGMNARDGNWRKRHRRVKAERTAIAWYLNLTPKPALPCRVLMTRIAPSSGLDDDNLPAALKAMRDQIAQWLGVDDRHRDVVRYVYQQERGHHYAVRVEFHPLKEEKTSV